MTVGTFDLKATGKRINFTAYEVLGTDVYRCQPGFEGPIELLDDQDLITTETGIQEGDQILVCDLFGWHVGVVTRLESGELAAESPTGSMLYCLKFVNDRPPLPDGTPAPPRWVCTGSANLRGLAKLEIHR